MTSRIYCLLNLKHNILSKLTYRSITSHNIVSAFIILLYKYRNFQRTRNTNLSNEFTFDFDYYLKKLG